MVIGQPGAGKSTLSRRLAEITGLPVVHIDHIHWQSGWIERPKPDKIALMRAEEDRERWIIEGGLSATHDTRMARADLLVWIDLGVWRRFWRLGRRIARWYGRTRPDLPEGCPEQVDPAFLRWVWDTRTTHRDYNRRLCAMLPAERVRILRSQGEIDHWLTQVGHDGLPA